MFVFLRRPVDISCGFCGDQNQLFVKESWTVSIYDHSDQNSYNQPRHNVSFNPNQVVFVTREIQYIQKAETFICGFAEMQKGLPVVFTSFH